MKVCNSLTHKELSIRISHRKIPAAPNPRYPRGAGVPPHFDATPSTRNPVYGVAGSREPPGAQDVFWGKGTHGVPPFNAIPSTTNPVYGAKDPSGETPWRYLPPRLWPDFPEFCAQGSRFRGSEMACFPIWRWVPGLSSHISFEERGRMAWVTPFLGRDPRCPPHVNYTVTAFVFVW